MTSIDEELSMAEHEHEYELDEALRREAAQAAKYHDELEGHREETKALDALRAEIAGLQAQVEDLRQGKTVAALVQVASDASALLKAMSDADKRQGWRSMVGFGDLRSSLAEALGVFTEEAEADLAVAAAKRSVELQNGPLSKELAAEKVAEAAVCPEPDRSDGHGGRREGCIVNRSELDPGIQETVMRLRNAGFETSGSCQGGSGHAFDRPTVQVCRGEGETLHETCLRLRAWCMVELRPWRETKGGAFTVSIHYLCQADRVMPESFVQVEFWTGAIS